MIIWEDNFEAEDDAFVCTLYRAR